MAACMLFWPSFKTASASERLSYPENISPRSHASLERYALENLEINAENLKIASADLNQDGLSEYILHSKNCDGQRPDCRYALLAETPQGLIPLGTVTGRSLMLGNGFSNGIRHLLAFDSHTNDYKPALYVWMPEKSVYGKKEE